MAFKFADRLAFEFFQRFLVRLLSPLMWLSSTLLIEARHRQDCQRMQVAYLPHRYDDRAKVPHVRFTLKEF